jgi:hypothetical protein
MHVLKILHKLLIQNKLSDYQKHVFFDRMSKLCALFGGYEYEEAFKYARRFFADTFLNGTLDITLKHKHILSDSHYSGYVRKQSDDDLWINALEGSLLGEIINPSPYTLNNIFHVEPDGSRSDLGTLDPYSSIKRNENQRKISISGEWNVTSIGSTNLQQAAQEIPIRISWQIQMEKAQMFIENILMSEKLNNITVETRQNPL